MTARAYRPLAVIAIAALGLGALSAPSAADVPAQDDTSTTPTSESTQPSEQPTEPTEPPSEEQDSTSTDEPTDPPPEPPTDPPEDEAPADDPTPPQDDTAGSDTSQDGSAKEPSEKPSEKPSEESTDKSSEESTEEATEETAQEALAPGLPAPPPDALGLVPAVTAPSPDADALTEDFSDQLEESAAAVQAAQEALASAEAQLEAAQERLKAAQDARDAAEIVLEEAARESAKAAVAEEQAERDLRQRIETLEEQREVLGVLARDAYRSGGPLSSLSVVLESTTPEEFAASLRGVEAVLRSEDVVIAGLAAELADLAEAEARLQAAREERERAEAVAERALDLATQATETAQLVADETEALVQQRSEALEAAETAQAEDLKKYRAMLAASQAVGYSIVGWSGALEAAGAVSGTGTMIRPATGSLTSAFGPRLHPILGYVKLHTGSDYGIGDGAIYAADDGTVVLAGYNAAYGNMTVVSHGRIGGSVVATLYAHQSRILVSPGDTVRKAELIGIIGSTGYSTGPHLHFEIRVDGTPVDPEAWLAGALTPEEYIGSDQAAADAKRWDDAA